MNRSLLDIVRYIGFFLGFMSLFVPIDRVNSAAAQSATPAWLSSHNLTSNSNYAQQLIAGEFQSNSYINSDDLLYEGDFDGDGKDEVLVANTNTIGINQGLQWSLYVVDEYGFGYSMDVHASYGRRTDYFAVADIDGDGKDDLITATPRVNGDNSLTWYWLRSTGLTASLFEDKGVIVQRYGMNGDVLLVADINGDAKDDVVVRTARVNGDNSLTWYWLRSTGAGLVDRGILQQRYGMASDQSYIADINGDGKDDIILTTARVNPNGALTWYWLRSTGTTLSDQGVINQAYGMAGDLIYPADFDGDAKDDIVLATARGNPSGALIWYWLHSTGTTLSDGGLIDTIGFIDDRILVGNFDGNDGEEIFILSTY